MSRFFSLYRGERYHLRDLEEDASYMGLKNYSSIGIFRYVILSIVWSFNRAIFDFEANVSIFFKYSKVYYYCMSAIHNYIIMHVHIDNIFEEYERDDFEVGHNEMDIEANTNNIENQADVD